MLIYVGYQKPFQILAGLVKNISPAPPITCKKEDTVDIVLDMVL